MRYLLLPLLAICLAACTATYHKNQVQDDSTDRVTVGKVQKEIRTGMSGAEVAQVLGSPNIVTTDENRQEVWIYDKVATDTVYSSSSGGIATLILGFTGDFVGAVLPHGSMSSGAVSTNQRTLTIVIKFDNNGKVRDFAYHASTF
ncbi:MAG TPA: hypothetical protein VEG25_08690 [Burkholderiales bacterium]|nr:hypothetical protein [Burkholderiales bacterium]